MGSDFGCRDGSEELGWKISTGVFHRSKFLVACLVGAGVTAASVLAIRFGGDKFSSLSSQFLMKKNKKPVRVYMDGCFDMMHYGHCNALRQARALGDQLVVGVMSDAEIIANKGPPVTPLNERLLMVGAVKWVDEVIPDAPYAITEEFMHKLFDEYNIDYIIHGDDPCLLPDGTDAYALAKKAGRYKQIKRTEGVSSTDIVGRMLLCVRERSTAENPKQSSLQRQFSHGSQKVEDGVSGSETRVSHFLPTSRRIVQFSNGKVFSSNFLNFQETALCFFQIKLICMPLTWLMDCYHHLLISHTFFVTQSRVLQLYMKPLSLLAIKYQVSKV